MIVDKTMQTNALDSAERAKQMGFWIYLMSDAVIFALLFATYFSMTDNVAGGPDSRDVVDLRNTFFETLLLLVSTLTCALAMVSAYSKTRSALLIWLSATLLLGGGFLALEFGEFQGLVLEGAGPGRSGFLSAFFTLIGTHGLHVSIGLVWCLVIMAQIVIKGVTAPVYSRLYRFSLFWHFLDLIWVGIFSFVYLNGVL